ncbi:hypothetical protein K438DRAFT_771778 [Mycena galopus ATCC 62051]|nr:hypothetical protein K438DRAFT_771778 [Mycena galopus ATCC 62051]
MENLGFYTSLPGLLGIGISGDTWACEADPLRKRLAIRVSIARGSRSCLFANSQHDCLLEAFFKPRRKNQRPSVSSLKLRQFWAQACSVGGRCLREANRDSLGSLLGVGVAVGGGNCWILAETAWHILGRARYLPTAASAVEMRAGRLGILGRYLYGCLYEMPIARRFAYLSNTSTLSRNFPDLSFSVAQHRSRCTNSFFLLIWPRLRHRCQLCIS